MRVVVYLRKRCCLLFTGRFEYNEWLYDMILVLFYLQIRLVYHAAHLLGVARFHLFFLFLFYSCVLYELFILFLSLSYHTYEY